jgi:hypothetical protein
VTRPWPKYPKLMEILRPVAGAVCGSNAAQIFCLTCKKANSLCEKLSRTNLI